MGQSSLPAHYGMLFVFPTATTPSFWMHNTPTALDIIFLSDTGTILTIESMTPNSDDRHTAPRPVHYALEVAHGYFTTQSVTVRRTMHTDDSCQFSHRVGSVVPALSGLALVIA
jgi:uncharacterized membrane protein (UPF0127 family)